MDKKIVFAVYDDRYKPVRFYKRKSLAKKRSEELELKNKRWYGYGKFTTLKPITK